MELFYVDIFHTSNDAIVIEQYGDSETGLENEDTDCDLGRSKRKTARDLEGN